MLGLGFGFRLLFWARVIVWVKSRGIGIGLV